MSFDFSTLITDRTQADVNYAKALAARISAGTASESELAEFNSAAMKGAYNYTDLNRVTAAMESLKAKLKDYGYAVPGYQRIKVPHVVPGVDPEPGPTSRLPGGYLELAWIESTGTQYIDTGVVPNQNTKVVVDVRFSQFPSQHSALFGTNDNTNACWAYYRYSDSQYRATIGGSTQRKLDFADPTQRVTVQLESGFFSAGDLEISFDKVDFSTSLSMFLFALNRNNEVYYPSANKMYSCRIFDSGALIRDYVPCINPSGDVGLYDLVTATFFGNSGTGSFVAGAIPRVLPDGYTQLEYIESNGTQHIDTGVKPNGSSRVVLSGYNLSASSKWVFGSWHNWYTNEFGFNFEEGSSAANGFRYGATSAGVSGVPLGAFYLDHNGTTYAFNDTKGTMAAQQFTSSYSMYLFRFNAAGNASSGYFVGRICYCKIYDNGTLIRDFVPCKNSGGVFGLYDILNDVFYQNAGSGTFAAGNEVASQSVAAMPVAVAVDKAEYDPHTWYEFDWPTPETMTLYLLNVSAIRSVLAVLKSTPKAPVDAVVFMAQDANDIETILLDVYAQLLIMPTTFVACGEALCGGDNL